MRVPLSRRGATLPLVIIVIAIMGVAVAISFSRLSSERRISADGQAQVDAFTVAQSGLSTYLASRSVKPGANQDTTYTTLPGGSAEISLRMVRESTNTSYQLPAVYVITSRGTATGARRYDAKSPPAERTVATYALWMPAPLDLDAAITSLGGMNKAGGSGSMDGNDACGVMPAIGGVAVPTGGYTPAPPHNPINGNPDNNPVPLGTGGVGGGAKDEVDIDWNGIINGNVLPANYVHPVWPGNGSPGFADWPVVRVNNPGGNFSLPGDGKGILIVRGDLTIGGSRTWEGLILVGGAVTSNGNNDVRGAVIAGLNLKLGEAVGVSQMNGSKSYLYDSCALSRALGRVGSFQRVRNGWTDTWSSY